MPTLRKKAGPDAGSIYVAWQSFAIKDDVIAAGTRLRGDHHAVVGAFANFVPDGTLAQEMPSPFGAVLDEAARDREERDALAWKEVERLARTRPLKLEIPDVMVCKADYVGYHKAQPHLILKGSVALADDETVLSTPDAWAVKR